jgi:hypothetical protein
MFVHISEQRRRVAVGSAADVCPRCAEAAACDVERVEQRLVVFFVPLRWKALHEEARCAGCGFAWRVKGSEYAGVVPAPAAEAGPLADLVARTNPGLVERLERAAALEEAAAAAGGRASADLKREVILHAFRTAGRGAAGIGSGVSALVWVGAAVGALVAASIFGVWARASAGRGRGGAGSAGVDALALALFVLLAAFVARAAFWVRGRYMEATRGRLYDAVARQVRPVDPGAEDLREAILLLRGEGNPLCAGVGVERLVRLIGRRLRAGAGGAGRRATRGSGGQ